MMALNYDFDMLSPTAKAIAGEPETLVPRGKPVALFREPETVEALGRAPQPVQDYLRASYFGINCYHSGAPAGRYPEADDAARIEVIEALAENVGRFDLPRGDDSQPPPGEFHLPSFFAAVAEAEPIIMAAPAPDAGQPAAMVSALPEDHEADAPEHGAAFDAPPAETVPAEDTAISEGASVNMTAAEEAPPAPEAVAVEAFEAEPAGTEPSAPEQVAADAVGGLISMMMEPEEVSALQGPESVPAPQTVEEAVRAPVLLLENRVYDEDHPAPPEAMDSLIAGMFAGTDAAPGGEGAAADGASAEEVQAVADDSLPPAEVVAARRGFRLPFVPRWMTAAAAFVVVGVAVGSAII